MASLTRGTTFVTGVANDVTADKLHALVDAATPTSGFIQDRTAETSIASNDTLLFGDASASDDLKRITVANFRSAATFGTTTSTAATITSGTITNLASTTGTITTGVIPTLTSTTLITTGTGTAASPAIVPTGDTNTGIFFPAADTIAFSEGGAEAMRIDSSGNVGIGTTSPSVYGLEISKSAGSNSGLKITSGTGTQSSELVFNSGAGLYVANNSTTLPTMFWTNGAERLRIDSSGNVGIGTSSPGTKLHVYGVNSTARFYTNGDAAGSTLHLHDQGASSGCGGQILFGASQGIFAGIKGHLDNGNGPAGTLIFQTRNVSGDVLERMSIDSAGNLDLVGSTAQKASGTTWANPSDVRIKKNIRDYEKGLDSLMQVRVREWEYNGKAGAVADTKSMGVVADEVETILPDTVSTYKAKLNPEDEEDSDIKKFDATEITWLLVKAVQELSAKVTALEAA